MLAGLLYVVGFGLRLIGAFGNYDELVPFILSVALIYVSPYVYDSAVPFINREPA